MSSSPLSVCPLPCVFSKWWNRGLLLPSHHEGVTSLSCILSDLGGLSHTLHEALCVPSWFGVLVLQVFLDFPCEMGLFASGTARPLSGAHRVSTALFCAGMQLQLLPPWFHPICVAHVIKCSSHRQLVAVSLVLISSGKCWFIFSAFAPFIFAVVMDVLYLVLLSLYFLFGFTIDISQIPFYAFIVFPLFLFLLFFSEEISVSILGLSHPHWMNNLPFTVLACQLRLIVNLTAFGITSEAHTSGHVYKAVYKEF